MAPRPDKVRRPGPDLDQMQKPLQVDVWNHEAYQDDASDEASRPLGIEAEFEVDDLRLR